ncbi:MAG: hypothetical protein ACLQVY_01570 [Limisphaerales bacterium]
MKQLLILWTAGWFLFPMADHGAETAQARLFCLSLQFSEGVAPSGGNVKLSSISGADNGELMPYSGTTWASDLALKWQGMSDSGAISDGNGIYVELLPFVDADNDGYNDFFEVAQAVGQVSTSGNYWTSSYFYGRVTATWSREAGSQVGTCILTLNDATFGGLGNFTCPFELLEYTGPLTYTPGSNTVEANLSLTQTGDVSNTLQGPIDFDKSSTDRFDTLTNEPGIWTNALPQPLSFDAEVFTRSAPDWPTNYGGYIYFDNGDPSTPQPAYQLWVLSIDDPNDSNGNGIPDFSDDPASVLPPPRAPSLALALGPTNLLLTISGDVNHTHQIQETGSLAPANWQTALSFLLTNDPQVVSLALPTGTSNFWRVVAR